MEIQNVFPCKYKMCFYEDLKYVSMKSEFSIGQKWIQNWSTVTGGEKGHKYLLVDGEKGYKYSTTNMHTAHKMAPNSVAQNGAK